MNKNTIIFLLLIFTAGLLLLNLRTCVKENKFENLNRSITDTLISYRNKEGLHESHIKLIEADNKNQLLNINTKDSTIKWLQKTVRSYKGNLNTAIVSNTHTLSKEVLETIILNHTDTVTIENIKHVYPQYAVKWENEWERGIITASKDSVYRDITIKNKYEITLGKVKNGWFKKKYQEVKLLNLNPNTETKELRVFSVKTEPKRLNLSLQAGIGLTSGLKQATYIGIGIGYTILQIK
jgi:hypothetical protein